MDHEVTETVDTLTSGPRPALAFIGAGRAGSALATALHDAGHIIAAVHSRTPPHASALAKATGAVVTTSPATAMRLAGVTFATVPDGEIGRVAAAIAEKSAQP